MNLVEPTAFLMQSSYCLSQLISSSFNEMIHKKWHIITEGNLSFSETKTIKESNLKNHRQSWQAADEIRKDLILAAR